MEATTLKSKKQINKGKLKKTMKNILCRPDPILWPQTSDNEGKSLEDTLNKYKLEIVEFKKPLWSELSQIPKKLRPKPPPLTKVDGLLFGIMQCKKSIETKECSGVLIDVGVNPKMIVQPLIELCAQKSIPTLCMKELRRITKTNFGISTTALGVKVNCLPELEKKIIEISKCHNPPKHEATDVIMDNEPVPNKEKEEAMADDINEICPYLYRTDNKSRVFTPNNEIASKLSNKFDGQNFIEISNSLPKEKANKKKYMKMIVKKISSNPNRKKVTKLKTKD